MEDNRYIYHKKGRIECIHCGKNFSSYTNLNLHFAQDGLGDPVIKRPGKQQLYYTESAKKRAAAKASKASRLRVKAALGDPVAARRLEEEFGNIHIDTNQSSFAAADDDDEEQQQEADDDGQQETDDDGQADWYKQLKKPPWTPPNWAFPVVWTILYILMGVSSWLIWLHGGFKGQSLPLAVYTFQLLLNFLWTPIFFGLHQVGLALVEILLLWTAIVATIYLFWHVNPLAAYLLVPYIVWVSLASTLNFYIWNHLGDTTNSLKKTI